MTNPVLSKPELDKLQAYLRTTFGNQKIILKARSNIKDSVEVYSGEDFLGTLGKDIDEGETSYNFNMAILDIDLEDTGI